MAQIINLRMARKARARAQSQQDAAANRARFGATKAERQRRDAEQARLTRSVEGAKLEPDT